MPRLAEYQEDEEIKALKRTTESGKASKAFLEKYMVQDGLLYYLSDRDEEVRSRLYIPKLIREDLLKQIHDDMGHMVVDKTYDLIGRKYFWSGCSKKSRIILAREWFVNQGVANVKTHLIVTLPLSIYFLLLFAKKANLFGSYLLSHKHVSIKTILLLLLNNGFSQLFELLDNLATHITWPSEEDPA